MEDDKGARAGQFGHRAGDAAATGPDAVDADDIRLGLQQVAGGGEGDRVILVGFDGGQQAKARKLRGDDGAEAGFTLFMAMIGARAGEQGEGAAGRPGHAPHHQTCGASGHAVVNADIGRARRGQDIRGDGDHANPRIGQLADRVAGDRVIDGDQADAAGAQGGFLDGFDQGIGGEAVDGVDGAGRDEGQMGRKIADRRGEVVHELAAAEGDEEFEMGRPGGQRDLILGRQIAQRLGGCQNPLPVGRRSTDTAVQHPVHRGGGQFRPGGNIGYRGFAHRRGPLPEMNGTKPSTSDWMMSCGEMQAAGEVQ